MANGALTLTMALLMGKLLESKRLTIPHRVSQAGLWEMWQRWGYECDESYATARGGAA